MDFGILTPFITPLYNVGKDIVSRFIGKKPDPVAIIENRKKWKAEFGDYLNERQRDTSSYGNLIIRDISRMDLYPEIDDKHKGISPWFKVELKGLYHRGFEVFLRVESVRCNESLTKWCWCDCDAKGAINAMIVGKIPFDVVKAVEWSGDQYYRCPHVYCEFSKAKKQPYEEIVLYRMEHGTPKDFFVEIAKYDDVTPDPKDVVM